MKLIEYFTTYSNIICTYIDISFIFCIQLAASLNTCDGHHAFAVF